MNDGRRGGLSPVSVRHAGVNLPGSVRVQNQRVSAETVNGGGSGEEGGIAVSHAFRPYRSVSRVRFPPRLTGSIRRTSTVRGAPAIIVPG